MMIRRLRLTTIFLIVLTCIISYHAVTEAEGSSGSTWAKALPPAHAIPSESECQPYIEKAIKKLADNSKGDETAETENDIDKENTIPLTTVTDVIDENELEQVVDDISNLEQNHLVDSSENDIVDKPSSQSTVKETETVDRNDSVEEEDIGGKEIDSEEENSINDRDKNGDTIEESGEEEAILTVERNETEDEVTETIVKNDNDNLSAGKIIEKKNDAKTVDDSDNVKLDRKKTKNDQKGNKISDNIDLGRDIKNIGQQEQKEVTNEDKQKPNEKDTAKETKKRKISIAKLIKDKIMKKILKQELEDDDNGDKDDNKNMVEESKEIKIDQNSSSSIQNTSNNEDKKVYSEDSVKIEANNDEETESDESEDYAEDDKSNGDVAEEELTKNEEIPTKLRSRKHITDMLQLKKDQNNEKERVTKIVDTTLKELKKLYETAIKPLEVLYKYRDLSNRHFGDAEIFSKPLILFMGPWSGGKSTIINYLLGNEFNETALRTGAEPSPAYFNILMWGENETVLDGTQLAADWTFSGLQKFGQGLLDRLRGLQIPNALLQKVNIVEIPGILEIRKQVERVFPFNDACQWFIDRADVIFLVYDPAKLDVGPETEAILDQLKGREYQTRIILNKADQIKADELMRVQATLIWNISPLMSSIEPPIMYTTSLWSRPYEIGAPTKLLHSQEIAFLKDLRSTVNKRVENKIASARRFAVRVRNHAKMVDCYLTTYYNHKSFFGNRKKINDDIVEHPQNYHIYEGLSTLTNISRYDLPDPDVYRDFFKLHPIYEFQRLSETCTYFRGCPINRLDIAIAYDLPELVGKYKKSLEQSLSHENSSKNETNKTKK